MQIWKKANCDKKTNLKNQNLGKMEIEKNENKLGLSCAKLKRTKASQWVRLQWLGQNVINSNQICGAGGGGVVALTY